MTPARLLVQHLAELGLNATCEVRFHHERRWRFDVACESERIGFEIEGGAWIRGRHTRGKGFIADLEKYNTATAQGWRIFRFTPDQVLKGEAKEFISQHLTP